MVVRSKGMVEILWRRRETRRRTEKTNFDLKPETDWVASNRNRSPCGSQQRAYESVETSRDKTSAEDSPRQRPERSPLEWMRVNGCGCERAYTCRHIATVVEMSPSLGS